ncbi:Type I restriction-modification system, DNA-methyltransferase subunit M / specificity subunit S [Streptococcus sp. DD10]|uniref:N-6 DNA methylase n=1 Tax=Streptococcus sp. DD10 TaxID=1777878 RepID=UPI00079202E6|nr:N-6 DNA methylase [Streptococcus sp. DD10]KXT74803.1 Type I restriction-modification system, DNA-methyltransferase subunit M / specificity subunit S [Streptococcus sp. DD10]
MITKKNFKQVLESLEFNEDKTDYYIHRKSGLAVDFAQEKLIYPEEQDFIVNERQTCNFAAPENFVVFECVHRLLEKGYPPQKIELEKRWTLGHSQKSGRADISVFLDDDKTQLFMIVECKTAGAEYNKALKILKEDGGQLFSYWQQDKSTQCLSLYASDFSDGEVSYKNDIVLCQDDANLVKLAEKDDSIKLYQSAYNAEQLHEVWTETYSQQLHENLIFGQDAVALDLNRQPLRKKDLKAFSTDDKIINRFEEILRHNAVSDKENAFNRLIALFICKLVDEEKDDDQEVDFQYKVGTDTYETLQDRLQQLYQIGMEKFMKEEIFYVHNDYAEHLFKDLNIDTREHAKNMLQDTIRKLKFYTNNDFSFKDVHNEELFLQNGKIVMEMVQLFEKYRISYASKHQFLGDMFEQLLNKGFKQNEGQFFTPSPITRFIWDCLPLHNIVENLGGAYPKVIDYACGSGHFLTEAVEAINAVKPSENNDWTQESIFGIEKDYRLARVSQVSMFMNGAGNSKIIFGDGLDNGKGIANEAFDILVANPPYSVSAFKSHLKLKNNELDLLETISNNGGEIEVLFCERIAQLLKSGGVGAVILPSSILSNDSGSYTAARELLLNRFRFRAIVLFGSKTFGATGTNTAVLFFEKISYPPQQDRLARDQAEAVFKQFPLQHQKDQAVLNAYLETIGMPSELYDKIRQQSLTWAELSESDNEYLAAHFKALQSSMALSKTEEKNHPDEKAQSAVKLRKFFAKFQAMETDKIALFALLYGEQTLIITAPGDNAKQKAFLGYDWSNRKGAEGIQIQQAGGKLYNDADRFAPDTLAACVRSMFEQQTASITGEQADYAKVVNTADMIDFQAVGFNRAIRTSVQKKVEIVSKFDVVLLEDFPTEIRKGKSITAKNTISGDYKVVAGGKDFAYTHNEFNRAENTITISASGANAGFVNFWAEKIFASDCTTVRGENDISSKYIYTYLQSIQENIYDLARGAAQPHVYPDDIKRLPIPRPPFEIQTQIVEACEKLDEEYNQTRMKIEEYRAEIESFFTDIQGETKRLDEVMDLRAGDFVRANEIQDNFADGLFPCYGGNGLRGYVKTMTNEGEYSLIGRQGALCGNVHFVKGQFHATEHALVVYPKIQIESYWLFYLLKSMNLNQYSTGTAQPGLSVKNLVGIKMTIIPFSEQEKVVRKIKELEAQITECQQKLDSMADAKKAVLDKYL